jgi:hypothetical protein
MTALARPSSNCKLHTHPFVSEGAPYQQTRNCLTVIEIYSWAPDGCLTPILTAFDYGVFLCGLVVRVPGYRSRGPGSIYGATRFSEK